MAPRPPWIPFKGKPKSDLFMEPHEYKRLMKAAGKDRKAYAAFVLMGFGGLRTIEAVQLGRDQLDTRKDGIWVKTAKRKDGDTRFVYLGKEYLNLLISISPRSGAVLGLTRRQVRYLFKKYRTLSGIRRCLGPHSMRHLAAIVRTENGASPQEVAAFLGHKKLDMVLTYANLRHERNAEMAKGAAKALFGEGH